MTLAGNLMTGSGLLFSGSDPQSGFGIGSLLNFDVRAGFDSAGQEGGAMKPLEGKVALVSGASRGVGKGIALGLGEAGATVYLTGRTLNSATATVPLSGTLQETASEVTRRGGRGVPVRCDHRNDEETAAVMDRIYQDHGQLHVLVNNAWMG